jgi:5-hydroxyisourate hydrolase
LKKCCHEEGAVLSSKSPITTHVLDTSLGKPAAGLKITLERRTADWGFLAKGETNSDGRIPDLLAGKELAAGVYRMTFDTAGYFQACQLKGFYPYVQVVFEISELNQHYHIPLLLSPYGYSTYRGS